MAVNYYGHFHLMELLLPKLEAQQTPSRVIVLTCQKVVTNRLPPYLCFALLWQGPIKT